MRYLILTTMMAVSGCASVEPLVVASHHSDPTASNGSEIVSEFLGAGATVTMFDGELEIDAAVGKRYSGCVEQGEGCGLNWGGMADLKWRPRRGR